MAYHLNHERAAAILADAAYLGDEATAKKWNITVRTIFNYRERLASDPKLSELFQRKTRRAEVGWAERLKVTMGSILDKAAMIVESIEPVIVVETSFGGQTNIVNTEGLKLLIDAGERLGQIALAMEMIHAGDGENDPPAKAGETVPGRPSLPN